MAPNGSTSQDDPARTAAVEALLRPGGVRSAFQPVVRLRDDEIIGYEALARMATTPPMGPDVWLAQANEVGLRAELEVACCVAATALGLPPEEQLLFVNLSPSLLADPRVADALSGVLPRLVLEISEGEQVDDYDALALDLAVWQDRGALVAVDDAGSGYASLRHVLRLSPNFIKLDRSLVDGIEHDRSLRALVASFVAFARECGANVIAEGVETRDQLEGLRDAGVHMVQGYLLGRPAPGWSSAEDRKRELSLDRCSSVTEVGDAVCEHLERRGVMPSLYLERDGLLRCVAQRGLWQVLDGLAPGIGITGRAFGDNALLVVEDVAVAEHYLEAIPGVVAEACAPLRVGGIAVGALNIDSVRPLLPTDIVELERCADLVSARLAGLPLQTDRGPLARLQSAAVRLERSDTEDAIIEVLLDAAREISGMSTAALVDNRGPGEPTATVRGPLREVLLGLKMSKLRLLVDAVVPGRSCYSAGDERTVGMIGTDELRKAGIRSVVVVPVRPATGEASMLAVLSNHRRQLHTDVLELLELLAAHAAARLETLAMIATLRRSAAEDPLTGLGNRLAFADTLRTWVGASGETGAVALLDVDGFKAVNDTFGHLEGDRVLIELADALRDAVRPEDGVFRLGGDEFAVVLPGTSEAEAVLIADRLRMASGMVLASRDAAISVGVAAVTATQTVDATLHLADQRLYEAKGRRVFWPPISLARR